MDLALLPDIFALAAFILAFRPLVRRVGAHADIWFLGWTFLLVHSTANAFKGTSGVRHTAMQMIALWAVDLCGLCFLLVSANVPVRRVSKTLLAEMGLPILLQATLYGFGVPWPALHYAACGLFFLPTFHLLAVRRQRSRAVLGLAVAFAMFGALMMPIAWRNPMVVAAGSLSFLFLSSAYLYVTSAPKLTRGVIAATTGLTAWALSYPVVIALNRFAPQVHLQHALLALPQYLMAAGMILALLEEHVTRTERMAMHDPLTDLPNRRLFEERLIATMEEARVTKTTVACLVIDVDNFKTINDTLGHDVGDELLRALAVRLSWHMSPRDILARTGGDEFTALLAGVTDEHHLRFIAGAMMSAASVPISVKGNPVDVRISVGIALSPDDAEDIDSLRRAADEAMYVAKRRGGSKLAFAGED